MHAFITGSTGLLGSNLARLLVSDGHEVRALVRSMDKARGQFADLDEPSRARLAFIEGDLENVAGFASALAGCDVLFHTAAYFREASSLAITGQSSKRSTSTRRWSFSTPRSVTALGVPCTSARRV